MDIVEKLHAGVITRSPAETQQFATEFAAELPPDVALALHGNLGVGKTTFVQGLARGFGVTEPVTSPTFNIYTVHRGPRRTLVHLDAYRLESAQQIENLLLEDFLISPWCLAVEWPEKIAGFLPPTTLHLDLAIGPDETHSLRLR
ncbi:MAG TPA: tRNA (adenosine(37)-N6)-threonylcarbamoyltransferase complex ATPase subunit type 1 TsaE [Opitutus sp.]|nr:tRNA (adenosine(37)-N6)-threonylcarbamoyltransferase complex ATPase subunit type 1 TsaE [Opitutus sp.]